MRNSQSGCAVLALPRFAIRALALPLLKRYAGGYPMAEEKRITETETKTKNDMFGDPKETKTTTKETKSDSSGNEQETKTEYKEKR
jgi:hypothetical protein